MMTWLLDKSGQGLLTTNANGLVTLKVATCAQAISQLVRLRLLVMRSGREYEPELAIDWMLFLSNRSALPVLGTRIRSLIADTDGVASVDMSNAKFQIEPRIAFGGLCFTTDCGQHEVSL